MDIANLVFSACTAVGTVATVIAALFIAISGWRKASSEASDDRAAAFRESIRQFHLGLLVSIAGLYEEMQVSPGGISSARLRAELLVLPGKYMTGLRRHMGMMTSIPHECGEKWMIYQRRFRQAEGQMGEGKVPPEWVRAELADDIASLAGDSGGPRSA